MLFLNKKQKFLSNDTFTLTTDSAGNLLTTSGILTNEANVGFEVPTGQSKYLTAGNDVVDLSKWNGSGSVNIGDAFSGDNDKVTVMANALANALANPATKDNLKLTSIENLEIVNSGVKTSVALDGANFKGLEAIKLIGDATTLDVSKFTQGVKIDATANADYIIGSSKADTINGGAGNDTIVGNGGNDVLTGGNGADTFIVGNAKDFGVDQILDFSAEDKISMTGGFSVKELKKFDASTFSTVTYKTLDSVLATFGSGGANETKAGDVVIFSYDGKTYALLSTGAGFKEANDALVDITGANVASLNESNFGGATSPTPPAPPAPTVKEYDTYAEFVRAVEFGEIPAGKQVAITNLTGADAGLLAVNKTYLDKIVAGGIKGVTGKIVVTVGEPGASNNFDSAAFAIKLADSVVKSDIVMDINGSDATNVIVTSFVGSINGSDGDDIIDASSAIGAVTIDGGDGNNVITGGSGNDNITTSGTGTNQITAGAGNDIITLNSTGVDTVVFAATAADNGKDTITEFTAGTGADADVLDVSAFLGAAAFGENASGTSSANTTTVTSGKNVAVLQTNAAEDNDKIKFTDAGKYVVIVEASSSGNVYYFEATAGQEVVGSNFADTFTKVAIVGTTVSSLAEQNFA